MRARLALFAAALAAVPASAAVPAYAESPVLAAHCDFAGVLTPLGELQLYVVGAAVAPAAARTEVTCRLYTVSHGLLGSADRACTGPACAVAFAASAPTVEPVWACVAARAVGHDGGVTVHPETCGPIVP